MSNYVKCYKCKGNFYQSMSEEVSKGDIDNANALDRRHEKYHICCHCKDKDDQDTTDIDPVIEMKSLVVGGKRLVFYPNFGNVDLQLEPAVNKEHNDNAEEESSSNPALDALIRELATQDNLSSDQDEENENRNCTVSVMFPDSAKVVDFIQNRTVSKHNVQSLLYNGKRFDETSIAKLYEIQISKYLTAGSCFFGKIQDPGERLITLDSVSNENRIHGSSKWKSKIHDEMMFRIAQCGHSCLRLSINLEPSLEANLAT